MLKQINELEQLFWEFGVQTAKGRNAMYHYKKVLERDDGEEPITDFAKEYLAEIFTSSELLLKQAKEVWEKICNGQ